MQCNSPVLHDKLPPTYATACPVSIKRTPHLQPHSLGQSAEFKRSLAVARHGCPRGQKHRPRLSAVARCAIGRPRRASCRRGSTWHPRRRRLNSTGSVSIQAGTCNHVDMFSGSPKNIALGRLILTIFLSFLSGMFLMQGLEDAFRGDTVSWIQLILSPALLAIAILHGKLVWQAIE